ncbi:MAG: PEGA domain-containing protein [Chloroflexota bacterium]|nr:PEGA domain-containing protein [Dehalococcoidia bacterium]MDW8253611.1 PEGA domain-containing protein [Chloroflexota bacterium]
MIVEPDTLTGLDAGTVLRGRYRLLHATAAAGGTVRAFDLLRQKAVALRLYGPTVDEAIRRRVRERAGRLSAVVTPAIAPLLSFDEQGDWSLAVRAWVEGAPLAAVVAQRGPLSPPAFAQLAGTLLEAISALERAGLRHGALSARNIILSGDNDTDNEAVVVDAGLAAAEEDDLALAAELRHAGTVLALALGLGERFDPRAARQQLHHGGALVDVLSRLVSGQPASFESVDAARDTLLEAIEAWRVGRELVPSSPPHETLSSADAPAQPASGGEEPATVTGEAPAAPRSIRIIGMPLGARVCWDGREAGVTPLVVVDRDRGAHRITIEADGYLPQQIAIEPGGDVTVQYALAPVSPPADGALGQSAVRFSSADAPFDLDVTPPRRRWWRRWHPWAIFGAGGAAIVIGTATGTTPLQLLGLATALGAVGALLAR